MIDTDKYEGHTEAPWTLYHRAGGKPTIAGKLSEVDWKLIADTPLILEAYKRLRKENETLRKMDWEYECLWTWLAENTNLLNTIEPLVEDWKKEMIE